MLRSRSALPVFRGAPISLLLVLVCSMFFSSSLQAKRQKSAPQPAATKEDLGLKNIPLTVGHEAKGLVLPNYDLKGNLVGRFEAGTAARLDENHVHFTNLKMTTYVEHEKPDLNVDMTEAVLNLDTRVIVSNSRTKIKRADFEIAGDNMQFSTLTHQGTLRGNVHMTIFNQSELTRKQK